MIIGLCGFKGSGKDTLANILVEEYNFTKISFADKLKDITSILFNWERKLLEGDTKLSREFRETKDEWWSEKLNREITPRKMLQQLGTDILRDNLDLNIWVNSIEKYLVENKYQNIVITDCRFKNEIEMLKKYQGKIIYVKRNEPKWFNNKKLIPKNIHKSEIDWIDTKFDIVISNDGSLEDLRKEIKINLFLNQK